MPTPPENPRRAELVAALEALGIRESLDYWLVYNGTNWKLRWLEHTTFEQHVQGDELVNRLLNR